MRYEITFAILPWYFYLVNSTENLTSVLKAINTSILYLDSHLDVRFPNFYQSL